MITAVVASGFGLERLTAGKALGVCVGIAGAVYRISAEHDIADITVRARPRRLSSLSVILSKSGLYGVFVWARWALNRPKRRFLGRAVRGARQGWWRS
jgi:hypothetical protein